MTPYYQDTESGITIFHADCRDVLPTLEAGSVDLVLTDPPYGVGYVPAGGMGMLYHRNQMPPVVGDSEPFDPRPLLRFPRLVLFGANHYAHLLPSSPTWFVWDKRDAWLQNTFADCEMAWANTGGPARLFHHLWNGGVTASERTKKVHPTQKPVALMAWILSQTTEIGNLVLDPYMGSGPVIAACRNLGRRAIGIEIEEKYCRIAVERLKQGVLPLNANEVEQGERSSQLPMLGTVATSTECDEVGV